MGRKSPSWYDLSEQPAEFLLPFFYRYGILDKIETSLIRYAQCRRRRHGLIKPDLF